MSHEPDFDNWDVQYYDEQIDSNGRTRINALFERPEDRFTFVVTPAENPNLDDETLTETDVEHDYVLIHPYYYSYSPKMWTDISEVEDWTESVFGRIGTGWSRSSLGKFEWDQVPDEMSHEATYKDNFPLPYDQLLNNIESYSTLANIYRDEPQIIPDPYAVDIIVRRLTTEDNEIIVKFDPIMTDSIREHVAEIVSAETLTDDVCDKLSPGDEQTVGTLYATYNEDVPFSIWMNGASLESEYFDEEATREALAESEFYSTDN